MRKLVTALVAVAFAMLSFSTVAKTAPTPANSQPAAHAGVKSDAAKAKTTVAKKKQKKQTKTTG
jgi:hypothetical protein